MNQFLSNKIIAGIVALALLVGVGVLVSSEDTSSTTRNAALVVATPCTKPGQVTKVSKQSVVCAKTNTGSLWYATMKAKGKAQPCAKPGAIRKKSKIVWVCGVVKKKKLWQATQPLPPAVVASTTVIEPGATQPTSALDSTQVATPDVPAVADNTVLADPKIPDDKIVTQVIDDVTPKQTGAGDVTPPVLASITATSSIDTSSADQSVTIEMNIADDASGVRFVVVNLMSPLGNSIVQGDATKVSGTALDGKYRVTLKVPKKSPQGDLAIDVWARDLVGNDLNTRNAATVKQTGAGDVTPPVLASITATSSIDTSSADQSVTIEMNITDDASGVRFVVVNLMSPLGNSIVQGDATKVSGTALDGKYRVTLKVPRKSPKGDLAIDVWARDLVGNDLNTRNAATVKQTGA